MKIREYLTKKGIMKRLTNIFDKIVCVENLEIAYEAARKNGSKKLEVEEFDKFKDRNLLCLHERLKNKKFTTSKYKHYTIKDRGKERIISDLPFYPDRIVHWALMQQVEQMFLDNFIFDTYAAIPNKGGHLALSRIREQLFNYPEETTYCLKLDIRQYFPSVKQEILANLIRRKIKDSDALYLIDDIIYSTEKGLPIGNYTSQYFGNFYLSYFDHWCKERLKLKRYYRYMDDIVILHEDKNFLHDTLSKIKQYLAQYLDLEVKNNWQVFPTSVRGIDFIGYRIFPKYVLLRKSALKKYRRKARGIQKHVNRFGKPTYNMLCTLASYDGWLRWCNGYNLSNKYYVPILEAIK